MIHICRGNIRSHVALVVDFNLFTLYSYSQYEEINTIKKHNKNPISHVFFRIVEKALRCVIRRRNGMSREAFGPGGAFSGSA